jgi:catechol 2,3-dioxygenase-like lactoylglutathione lyase family enzyme
MTAQLDHMIVFARDREVSAAYLAEMLGAPAPKQAGHFTQVQIDHGLTMDFMTASGNVSMQHYAFLVSEAQFDASFAKIKARQQTYWADPYRKRPNEVNTFGGNGGRLVYFEDPSGHFLEIRTRPSMA